MPRPCSARALLPCGAIRQNIRAVEQQLGKRRARAKEVVIRIFLSVWYCEVMRMSA